MKTRTQKETQAERISNSLVRAGELFDLMDTLGGKVRRISKTPDGAVNMLIRFSDASEASAYSAEDNTFWLQ